MHVLVMYGLPPALAAQLAALFMLGRSPQVHEFMGYPVNLRSLWVPVMLVLLVLALRALLPTTGIVPLIAAAAFLLSVGAVLSPARAARHVRERLPHMVGELALFLAAGVLSLGLRALLHTLRPCPGPPASTRHSWPCCCSPCWGRRTSAHTR